MTARAFAGTSVGEARPQAQNVFQLGGDSPGDAALSIDSPAVHLRGYPQNEFRGSRAGLLSLEYRFPIVNLEHGFGSKPLFIERMHGAIFGEAGNAWEGDFHGADLKRSVGAEVRFDITAAYFLLLTIRFGVARGLDEKGKTMVIGGLWSALLFS